MCSGDGERLPMNFITEDAESAAHVKVGGNNQDPTAFHLSQDIGAASDGTAAFSPM